MDLQSVGTRKAQSSKALDNMPRERRGVCSLQHRSVRNTRRPNGKRENGGGCGYEEDFPCPFSALLHLRKGSARLFWMCQNTYDDAERRALHSFACFDAGEGMFLRWSARLRPVPKELKTKK